MHAAGAVAGRSRRAYVHPPQTRVEAMAKALREQERASASEAQRHAYRGALLAR